MGLNCKPGDLAIIVRAEIHENIGKIVRCIELADKPVVVTPSGKKFRITNANWRIDKKVRCKTVETKTDLGYIEFVPDSSLRPLRDTDGEDETLTWVGKPEKASQ